MESAKGSFQGHPPTVIIKPADLKKILPEFTDEQKKYIKCWDVPDYRVDSPGENALDDFKAALKEDLRPGQTLIDWGCGTGRAGYKLYKEHKLDVTLVDFAFNCLDDEIAEAAKDNQLLRFMEHDLNKPIALPSMYGYCTDVMEHIPEDEVDDVLDTILNNSRHVYFRISTKPDAMGSHPKIDAELHVTVHDYQWWLEKLVSKTVIVHSSAVSPGIATFYVTAWSTTKMQRGEGRVNTDPEIIKQQIIDNAKLGIQEVKPFEEQIDLEVMLLAGGPSLNDYEDEILKQYNDGIKIISTNGTYNWCLERGIRPSLQLVMDAREFNKRFVDPVCEKTKYIVSSQCHPAVFEGLPHDRTWMWHTSTNDDFIPIIKEHYGKIYEDWFPCVGGSTVMLRGLSLMVMLGFRKLIVYGFDSCVRREAHHAYDQPENDNDLTELYPIVVGGGTAEEKSFLCRGWQVWQAQDFLLMVPRYLTGLDLDIKGDGLIAHLIKVGARAQDLEELET